MKPRPETSRANGICTLQKTKIYVTTYVTIHSTIYATIYGTRYVATYVTMRHDVCHDMSRYGKIYVTIYVTIRHDICHDIYHDIPLCRRKFRCCQMLGSAQQLCPDRKSKRYVFPRKTHRPVKDPGFPLASCTYERYTAVELTQVSSSLKDNG